MADLSIVSPSAGPRDATWAERWLPNLITMAVAVLVLAGSVYASYQSREASDATVRTVKETFNQQGKADLRQLRRTTYISYLAETEKFYRAPNGGPLEPGLLLQEAKALIVATPPVRAAIQALNKELLDPPKEHRESDEWYLKARSDFIEMATNEVLHPGN